jgi:hypothetical protein
MMSPVSEATPAEAMGTEAVHRALVRFAQGQLGKDVGVPNDVGFENFDWDGERGAGRTGHRLRLGQRPARPVLQVTGGPDRAGGRHAGQPHSSSLSCRRWRGGHSKVPASASDDPSGRGKPSAVPMSG